MTSPAPGAIGGPAAPLLKPSSPIVLAAVAAAAGAIHLALAPSRGAASAGVAWGYSLAGWAQLFVALAVLVAPRRPQLLAGIALNAAIALQWIAARTGGGPETVATLLATGFVAGALARLPERRVVLGLPVSVSAVAAAAVLGASTVAIAVPGTGERPTGGELATGAGPIAAPPATTAPPRSSTTVHGDHGDHGSPMDHGTDHGATHAGDHTMDHGAATDGHGTADHTMDHGGDHGAGHAAAGDHGAMDHTGGAMDHGHGTAGHAAGPTAGHDHGATGTGHPMDHSAGAGHPADHSADHGHGGATPTVDPAATPIVWGDDTRCDKGFNIRGYWRDAMLAGVDIVHGPTDADLNAPHTMSEVDTARLVQNLATVPDSDYYAWLQRAGGHDHAHTSAATGDLLASGPDHHSGPQAWKAITDPATCQLLADQLATARAVAMRYPRAKDAEKAGYKQATPYVMGIGAHWVKDELIDETFDITQPEMILYDGNDENANVIGLSYEMHWKHDTEPTVGFAGRNDHYHRHMTLCFKDNVTIGDSTMTEEQCKAMGGTILDGRYLWMSHAWVVPGCESPWGVFSGINPVLDIAQGNESGRAPGCSASFAHHGTRWMYSLPGAPPVGHVLSATAAAVVLRRRRGLATAVR